MIKVITTDNNDELLEFVKLDNARNYFIRLGLENEEVVFDKICGQWDETIGLKSALFKRLSGNLQFCANGEFEVEGFAEILRNTEYNYLISPKSFCDVFSGKDLFESERDGAYIAKLEKSEWQNHWESRNHRNAIDFEFQENEVEKISVGDLAEIVELYRLVFDSFCPETVMRKKLEIGRGRGACIRRDGKIVCVAQSEFEDSKSAVIVGVATSPRFQRLGLAAKCLSSIISELVAEGKDLYLQYDNTEAGKIYKQLGFKEIDRVKHYKKRK